MTAVPQTDSNPEKGAHWTFDKFRMEPVGYKGTSRNMTEINPQRIRGKWRSGHYLDFHTISSTAVGENAYGHMQFETVRPPIAGLLYKVKYRGDSTVVESTLHNVPMFRISNSVSVNRYRNNGPELREPLEARRAFICDRRFGLFNLKNGLVGRRISPVSPGSILRRVAILATCVVTPTAMSAFGQGSPASTAASPSVQARPYVPTLTYDVASVRPCLPGHCGNGFNSPLHSGQLTGTGLWAEQLIGWAYGVDYRTQVVGGPDWVKMARSNETRFNLEAKSDSATVDILAKVSDDQAKLEKEHMLQALLEDRFGLKVHMETRSEPALALTVAKHGPKLQKGVPPPPRPEGKAGPWPAPIESERDPRGVSLVAHGASIGGDQSITNLAGWLQFHLGKRVIDQTGITGTYNFTLQFHGALSDMQPADESMWPPIETAIQEQLGLQLKDTKAPLQVLVIDHIQQPSPN